MLLVLSFLCSSLSSTVILSHGVYGDKVLDLNCLVSEEWMTNTSCAIKAVRGTAGIINAVTYLKQTVHKFNAHIRSFRWYNGWKPFVINGVVNVCRLFGRQANYSKRWLRICF
ncbi:uncharacterized protein LOC119658438 [Hermetia illucens]|uniref:uncharacterized protein LOC119658438 n=1 Tax=Hermetia illucens TaxID=343691 RepID=UPI0018CC1EBF|nr:uncharacterized protein LOC119658438 [Hermetia illucens]